jgi:hypothetical protein
MCKFCNFKYGSDMDSFAFGENINGFYLSKDMNSNNERSYTLTHNGSILLNITHCPMCGSNLYFSYCYKSDDSIWEVLDKE